MSNSTPPLVINSQVAEKQAETLGTPIFDVPILVDIWTSIRNRKFLIATIVVGFLVLGLLITLMMTPYYTAKARIEISRFQENVTNVQGIQPSNNARDLEFYQTQYSLLQARSLAERVARSTNLTTDNAFFEMYGIDPEGRGFISGGQPKSLRASQRNRRLKLASNLLLSNISINPIRGSSLVDVTFSSPNPTFSAKITNEWVAQFIESNLDRRYTSTADAKKYLQEQLGQLRTKLEESEQQLVSYASAKEIITLSSSINSDGKTSSERTLVSADLEALNGALASSIADRIQAQSEASTRESSSKQSVENPTIAALQQKRAEIVSEYAKLMVQYEPGYPAAQALEAQIKALEQSIAAEISRVQSSARTSYNQALERENRLRAQVNGLKQDLLSQKRSSIQYNIYQRNVDTNRELYDGLLQRYKEIGVAGVGSNNVAVVDAAPVPGDQSSPNLMLNLALALIGGILVSGGTIFALEQLDQSLKDPADVKKLLHLPVLGSVPLHENEKILEELDNKKSFVSEAYMTIQTNLSFVTDHGIPRSFVITSTRPNEGKSTSAYSIARVLERTGRKVLLIDADLRVPSLHHLTGISNKKGLSNILAGEDDYRAIFQKSDFAKLTLLPAGPIPPNASELLNGDRLTALIKNLVEEFDHIILDGPPVLGIADIPLIAQSVEGVVFAVEANGSKLKEIQGAIQRILSSNVTIFGAIVTKLDIRRLSYFSYSYGYGYDESRFETEAAERDAN